VPNHFDVLILVMSFMLSGMYMLKLDRRNKGSKSPNKKEYTTWESKPGLNGQLGELDNRRMRLAVVILLPKSPGLSGDRSNHALLQKIFCTAFPFGARRRLAWLPTSIIRGRAAGPATASVNS